MIESELREEIKEEIIAILEDFDIFSREDFEDSIELEPDSGLIDTLMAVAEEYGLFDEDMDELLDEVLDEISAGPDREIIEKYYELAEQDRYEEAIKFIDEYIQNAGDDVSAEVLSIAGNDILMYTEDLDKGIKYFHMAMEKEPENPDIYWGYFTDLDEITDEYPETIDDAILCLTKIIEICSKIESPDEVKSKRYDYIDEDFDKETDIARRYRDLAVIYLKIPNYEKAGECINKTLKVLPDDEFANSIKDKIVEVIGEEPEICEDFCKRESGAKQKRMASIALYGAGSDLSDLVGILQSIFGEYANSVNKVESDKIQVILMDDSVMNISFMEDANGVKNQIIGMSNYFAHVSLENAQVKEAAIHQIRMFTCILGTTFELTEDNNRTHFLECAIHELAKRITAFVLYPNMQLFHPDGKLLISMDGETEFDEYYAIVRKEAVINKQEMTEKDVARKERNIQILKEQGIPYIEHMDVSAYDATSVIPAKEDVLLRAISIFACSVKSEVYTCGQYENVVEKTAEQIELLEKLHGFQNALSVEEKLFLENEDPGKQDLNKFGWRYECCAVLLWALNLIEMKKPSQICDAAELGGIIWNNDFNRLLEKAVLRERDEILDFQDLVRRYDWACIEMKIRKQELPMLSAEIIYEWHYALNWLTGEEGVTDWDKVTWKA